MLDTLNEKARNILLSQSTQHEVHNVKYTTNAQ